MSSEYRTLNPATGELLERFELHGPIQIERALAAADAAYRASDWRGDLPRRLAVLTTLAEIMERDAEELAAIVTTEMGKRTIEAMGEVQLCAGIARYYADQAKRLLAPIQVRTEMGNAWVEHHPIGTLLAIEPWNFPFYQLMRVVAPAIAVGNSVLFKHAPSTPRCALAFEQLVRSAGAPDGAVTNLFLDNDQVHELIGDDRIQGVALTGSERAGIAVGSRASAMLKKCTLELGGNDVFIVLEDADLDHAVNTAVWARLFNAGQACTGSKRFIVHQAVAKRFTAAMQQKFAELKVGDPTDPETTLAPLSSENARDGLAKQVAIAVEHGATALIGGKLIDRPGFYFEATILESMTAENPAYGIEFFGPVAQIFAVANDEAAITLANDSRFGLGGVVFGRDIDRARRVASRIESGMTFINTDAQSRPELPFGGIKCSGFGRELGESGIMEFVNRKLVVVANSA